MPNLTLLTPLSVRVDPTNPTIFCTLNHPKSDLCRFVIFIVIVIYLAETCYGTNDMNDSGAMCWCVLCRHIACSTVLFNVVLVSFM